MQQLLERYGEVDDLLARTPDEIAAVVRAGCRRRSRKGGPDVQPGGGTGAVSAAAEYAVDEGAQTEQAIEAVLAQRPAEYLAAVSNRGEGYAVITWDDALYPPALRHLSDPPLCLFVRARCRQAELHQRLAALAQRTLVAVVGTRGPSAYGEEMAALLGRDLTRHGLLVVSGLALGIDALAQAAALRAGTSLTPATVAVLGCGPDVVYPKANAALRDEIAAKGLLVSEFAWGVSAWAWRFPARNRVMAALCAAVVVVEGSTHSGARLTADFALQLGREVLAVPGEAGRRLAAAPHELLRHGATLCEAAQDVLNALALTSALTRASSEAVGPAVPRHVLSVLGALADGPLTPDQLVHACALPSELVNAALSELEIDGLVRQQHGGGYRVTRT
jgi:DNA processing protein